MNSCRFLTTRIFVFLKTLLLCTLLCSTVFAHESFNLSSGETFRLKRDCTIEETSSDTFFIINREADVLKIKGVSAKCGCITTEYEKRDFTNGDSAKIIVHHTPGFVGSYSENIYIKTNKGKSWIHLYGEVKRKQ